jgi:predicted GNAT family acetyltransferase
MQKPRIEIEINGEVAYADYRIEGEVLFVDFVFAPPALRGTGAAGKVMEAVVAIAEEKSLKITPICGYAASWLKRKSTK